MKPNATLPPDDLDAVLADATPEEAARLRDVWALAAVAGDEMTDDPAAADAVWQSLAAATTPHPTPHPVRLTRLTLSPLRRTSWLALAAVILAGAFALTLWLQPVVHTAAPGDRLTVALPDGSTVELNSGTMLRHARRFGSTRQVYLEGEAFFYVAPDTDHPFVVETFNARVTVLGTQFNVRAWPEGTEPRTTVALAEGRVTLAPLAQPTHEVEMVTGETRTVGHASAPSAPDLTALPRAMAWRSGDLIFKDERLGTVLDDVARRFGVTIQVEARPLLERRVGFAFRSPADAEAVIRDLCIPLGLHYRATATGFVLFEAPMN